jgi:pimeloyl-ACP methyl ester carboxylesterase
MSEFAPFRSAAARETYLARHAERSRDWPQPWSERMVPTPLGETYVRVCGPESAPPLVMLPGVGSPSYLLAPQAHGLASRFRLYAVDNIYDIGRSVASRPLKNADDFAAWLDGLFDALALKRANVLGLSYGGWVFAQYALRRPERVDKLVLLAPAGTVAPINFAFIWRAVATLVLGRRAMVRFADWASPGIAADPKWAQARANLIEDAILGQASFARRQLVPPLPLTDADWGRLAVPTLLLFGDREVIFDPVSAAEKIRRLAPSVKLEVLPGLSHDFFVVAAEEVNRRVAAFLTPSR